MKNKITIISLLIISSVLLTACTKTEPNTNATAPSKKSDTVTKNSINEKLVEIRKEEVFAAVETATDLINPEKMVMRRKVDDIYFNDEGEGYLIRLDKDDEKLPQLEENVDKTLKKLGLLRKEYSPDSDSSPVVKYIQYTGKNLKCTLETRYMSKITENPARDFTFGCLQK